MRVYYLGVVRNATSPAIELCHESDISGLGRWGMGAAYQEAMTFGVKSIAAKTPPGKQERTVDEPKDLAFHCTARREGVAAIACTNLEYPGLTMQCLLRMILDEFCGRYTVAAINEAGKDADQAGGQSNSSSLWGMGAGLLGGSSAPQKQPCPLPTLKAHFDKYQDPEKADNILKVYKELVETQGILTQTMEQVLGRGEKLDALVEKSNDLSASSKFFYKQAKKQNSCCIVM